jgi:uncharacterized membrane protein YoaK (UPF0700 family)
MVLFTPDQVYSRRHSLTWMLLAFSSGCVNAAAVLACGRFVTHVTGTLTRIGVAQGWDLALDFVVVLLCFILGAMSSVLVIDGRHHRGLKPLYWLPLTLTATLLAIVATVGVAGGFGSFGVDMDLPRDFALLSLLSLASGIQNAAVSTTTRLMVRTTHMSGPATDFGVDLAVYLFASGEARRRAGRGVLLRGGKISAFVLGGFAGALLAGRFHYGVFFAPAALVLLATALSFVPSFRGARTEAALDGRVPISNR